MTVEKGMFHDERRDMTWWKVERFPVKGRRGFSHPEPLNRIGMTCAGFRMRDFRIPTEV